eukprot:3945936-Prorocentrum_lima.AAC.1
MQGKLEQVPLETVSKAAKTNRVMKQDILDEAKMLAAALLEQVVKGKFLTAFSYAGDRCKETDRLYKNRGNAND